MHTHTCKKNANANTYTHTHTLYTSTIPCCTWQLAHSDTNWGAVIRYQQVHSQVLYSYHSELGGGDVMEVCALVWQCVLRFLLSAIHHHNFTQVHICIIIKVYIVKVLLRARGLIIVLLV